jgi:hypothetical protein
MEGWTPARIGMTPALRRLWLVGGALLVVGLALPGGGAIVSVPAVLVLAIAAGVTAARGRAPHWAWSVLAWLVPAVPTLVLAGFVHWLYQGHSDPMAVVLVFYLVGTLALATWGVFFVALLVEHFLRYRSSVRPATAPVEE